MKLQWQVTRSKVMLEPGEQHPDCAEVLLDRRLFKILAERST